MRTIYKLTAAGVWTGDVKSITVMDGYTPEWIETDLVPPAAAIVQWQGVAGWVVLDAPPVVPTPVPREVTRRQAKQALILAGLIDSVQPAIDAIPDPIQRRLIQVEWDDSQFFERDRPALLSLAGALGLTDAQLDQLFVTASTL